MPDRPCNSIAVPRPPTTGCALFSFTFCLSCSVLWCLAPPVSAEMRVISSQGEFRMGDRDTREDAMRLATEAAKRNALEQVATYVESVTVVDGTDITKDEIRTYTAGLILVLDQQAHLWLEGDTVVVSVELTSQIDTDEVGQAILAFRENESARHQLALLRGELEDLHQELDAANQLLASATTAEEAQQASLQRQDLLNRAQSNAMVSQAWTDWVIVGPYGYPASWGGIPPQGLLNAARGLYPANPHVEVAQQIIVMRPPAMPSTVLPQATRPVLRSPGDKPVPLTLNEVSHSTASHPVQLGSRPAGAHVAMAPSTPAHVPAFGQQAASGSVRSLQQFLQPPAAAQPNQAPGARRLPPAARRQRW